VSAARVVQKYGGTSVGSVELIQRVAARVHALRDAGNEVAVVVSAMGDSTDRLLDMARAIAPEPDVRELDQLLATGEQVSVALLAMALRQRGCPSHSYCGFQLPIRTTDVHGRARIESIDGARLEADLAAGVVPVIAGFQGLDPHGDVTTIGRGGSDTTAVAVAVALRADECQILTDVDGVYTTDPRTVPDARRLDRLTFDEMLELAGQGSRVLHLRSVEFASKYGVRLRVLSSFRPDGPGTLITSEDKDVEAPVVSGIAFHRDEAQVTVRGVPDGPGVAYRLLEPVSRAHVEVDMIVANAPRDGRVDFAFTVHRDDHRRALEAVRAAAQALGALDVESDATVAKLSIVGVGMRSHAGVATRLFEALAAQEIAVRLISTSEIKITVLLDEAVLERAVRAVHEAFGLSRPPVTGSAQAQ
jgi:aspartate kinase